MRFLQWIAWIVVIAFAAVLPWLVQDWLNAEKARSARAANETPEPAPAEEVVVAEADPEPEKENAAPPDPEPTPPAEPESESPEETPTPPKRSTATKVSDFFRQAWLNVRGSRDERRTESMHSDRSREAALRIAPTLEEELAAKNLEIGQPIFLRIFKESDELELWMEPKPGAEFVLFKTWPICSWSGELGPKLKEGDGQSPEGFYFVPPGRMNPESQYHLSFDIGFPNDYDRHHDRTGSYLMIHGDCVSIGCYAMTNPAIEEIYTLATAALEKGQPFFRVHSFPFRMTDDKMDTLKEDGEWFDFWANLKIGYDYFEFLHRPPNVIVTKDGKYEFE